MWFQKYNVALQTPIGTRQGHMTVSVQEHQICGTLDVLKQANPFSGTISETGECSICGELTSLFRSIPYQGTGNVTQEAPACCCGEKRILCSFGQSRSFCSA